MSRILSGLDHSETCIFQLLNVPRPNGGTVGEYVAGLPYVHEVLVLPDRDRGNAQQPDRLPGVLGLSGYSTWFEGMCPSAQHQRHQAVGFSLTGSSFLCVVRFRRPLTCAQGRERHVPRLEEFGGQMDIQEELRQII